LNPPKADELFDSPPLGEIMDILIDTPLLCGGVVYY